MRRFSMAFRPLNGEHGSKYGSGLAEARNVPPITGTIPIAYGSVPRGTLAMVNMSGYQGLEEWMVPISLVA